MRPTALVLALALAGTAPAAQAATLSFSFQFTNVANGGGTVSGVVRGLAPNGTVAASSVQITGNTGSGFAPAGVDPAVSLGEYIGTATQNSFIMQNGSIFSFNFISIGAVGFSSTECCSLQLEGVVNGESDVGLTFDPQGDGPHGSFQTNISFAVVPGPGPDPSPVPLPASGPMALAGLVLGWAVVRRRARG
jgi:MYXO-CTERM domain-containing protein